MGRAIIREPKVFLFDEPLSNLDAKLRVQMRVEIRRLHKRLSATSVFVTHDQVEAMTLADKLIVMNKGNVEQVGTPLEIYHRPRTRFVGSFIGSPAMNFFDSTVAPGGDFVLLDGIRLRSTRRSAATMQAVPFLPVSGRSIAGWLRRELQTACRRLSILSKSWVRAASFTSRSMGRTLLSPWMRGNSSKREQRSACSCLPRIFIFSRCKPACALMTCPQ